jgi:hypothetical protein
MPIILPLSSILSCGILSDEVKLELTIYQLDGLMKERIAQECLDQEESARPVYSMTELHAE